MPVQIVFETHSISVDNERGVATGWLPGALSERGRELSIEMGRRHVAEPVAAIFSSDSRRAVETTELAFGESGLPIVADWRLRECNYGDLNGAPVEQLHAVRARHVDQPFPHGESYRDVVHRVGTFLDELATTWPDALVVLVGHSATRWALDHLIDHKPLEQLVLAPFAWQPGWRYLLSDDIGGRGT